MIRLFAGTDAGFVIGPSRANPFTGEIFDADIGFSEVMVRGLWRTADATTRAHLQDVVNRINAALNAQMFRTVE